MTPTEIRIVKRRLETYQDLIALAEEKERQALSLSEKYYQMATPSCLPLEAKPPTESPVPMESRYLEIFAEQKVIEDQAREYREQAHTMERFICWTDQKDLLEAIYIAGATLKKIADENGLTIEGTRRRIDRTLLDTPAPIARDYGLL